MKYIVGTLHSDKYKLNSSIEVTVQTDGDGYHAEWGEVGEYGTGETIKESISDLTENIISLYETLRYRPDIKIGKNLQRIIDVMKSVIIEK